MRIYRPMALLGASVGLALLVGILVALVVARQPETVYAPNSPQATVASFLRYLEQGQLDRAYALTTEQTGRQSFTQQFAAWRSTTHRAILVQTDSYGTTTEVTVGVNYAAGGSVDVHEQTFEATIALERLRGVWRISSWYGLP